MNKVYLKNKRGGNLSIIMDHQIFSAQKYGGISRVFTELYSEFGKRGDVECRIPLIYSDNEYLREVKNISSFLSQRKLPFKKTFYRVINQLYTCFFMLLTDYDLFQPTYYRSGFLKFLRKKPYVLVVHDMIHELMPNYFSRPENLIRMKKKSVQNAKAIIAISQNTKEDLINIYNVDPKKITVIHWGCSLSLETAMCPSGVSLPSKYILFVGNRSGYKNFQFFLESIRDLLLEDKELRLVCAGGGVFSLMEKEYIRELGLSRQVRQIAFKNDAELAYIYNKALVFVFPSLYEGFGLPILEAFECNCPVAISDASSFPEVAEDAAEYFNPEDKGSIKKIVQGIVYDEGKRKELISKGQERLNSFSWEKAADGFVEVYKSVVR